MKILLTNDDGYDADNLKNLYQKLSKDHEMQAIGRGQRLGRTDPLTVTYLTHTNEYEY